MLQLFCCFFKYFFSKISSKVTVVQCCNCFVVFLIKLFSKISSKVTVVQCCNWPQQCSPLSTVFDLVKQVNRCIPNVHYFSYFVMTNLIFFIWSSRFSLFSICSSFLVTNLIFFIWWSRWPDAKFSYFILRHLSSFLVTNLNPNFFDLVKEVTRQKINLFSYHKS